MAGRSLAHGDMARHQRKLASKKDPELEKECQTWIETILGEPFPKAPTYEDALRNGVVLCKLMNKLLPGSVKRIQESGADFKMMENVAAFQDAARAYGLHDNDVFQTVDLWEKRNIPQVTQCIFSLGRVAQLKPDWKGPILGPKMSEESKREFTEQQLRAGQGIFTG